MKVYCGRNRKGKWKASTDKSKIYKFDNVFECEVDIIHNNRLFMIRTYYGYDYDYSNSSISDDNKYVFKLFHSVSAAKKNDIWKKGMDIAQKDPENHYIDNFTVASKDDCLDGKPFTFGDVMEGKFCTTIFPVRVI